MESLSTETEGISTSSTDEPTSGPDNDTEDQHTGQSPITEAQSADVTDMSTEDSGYSDSRDKAEEHTSEGEVGAARQEMIGKNQVKTLNEEESEKHNRDQSGADVEKEGEGDLSVGSSEVVSDYHEDHFIDSNGKEEHTSHDKNEAAADDDIGNDEDGDDDDGDNDGVVDMDEWLTHHGDHEGTGIVEGAPHSDSNEDTNNQDDLCEAPEDSRYQASDDEKVSTEEECFKLLDVNLLEEICEEAANMTIKEALIHSLKPNVRAGITTGNFEFNESEILELELYCEDFIGGMLEDILKKSSVLGRKGSDEDSGSSDVENAKKQLTGVNLLELKLNCDHFVHNIIAESIIDSSIITAKVKAEEEQELQNSQALNDVLTGFKNSKDAQKYFSQLTSDIVRTALSKVSSLKESNEGLGYSTADADYSGSKLEASMDEHMYHTQTHDHHDDGDHDFEEFDDGFGYGFKNRSTQSTSEANDITSFGTPDVAPEAGRLSLSRASAGEMSLEFDMDWVKGVLHDINSSDGDRKEKIIMRELEFDEHANIGGTELLAPVFLAVAEDNEDDNEFQGMRRKAQSIDNLCSIIEEKETIRQRSQSLNVLNRQSAVKPRARSIQDNLQKLVQDSFDNPDVKSDPSLVDSDDERLSQSDAEHFQEEEYISDRGHGPYDEEEDQSDYAPDDEPQLEREPEAYQETQPEEYSEPELVDYSDPEYSDPEMVDHSEAEAEQKDSEAKEEDDRYRWHTVRVNKREKVLDLKLLEPYMKVITHGGFHSPNRAVIVVIAACYLPDKSQKSYDFLMEQVFFYLISTLELLATTEEFYIVYFNGGTTQSNMPALTWMKRFYQHIEGGLKKNMINMYIVHPNLWLKTVIRFAKAFVSTNFWHKLQFIGTLKDLSSLIPIEYIYIPDEVIRADPHYRRVHNL